jgi:hypothetical protein
MRRTWCGCHTETVVSRFACYVQQRMNKYMAILFDNALLFSSINELSLMSTFCMAHALRPTRLKHVHPHFRSARRMQETSHRPRPDASHQGSPNDTSKFNQDRHDEPDEMELNQPHDSHGALITAIRRNQYAHSYV